MRVQISRRAELLDPQLFEKMQRRAEAELDVGEEEVGAAEDQTAGFFGRGGELAGEEVEDGSDVGGVEVGGEEVGGEEGESLEIGVGEALGFEEVDGGEDVVGGVGEREFVGFRIGVDDAEGFQVAEVFAVGSAELDEVGIGIWRVGD